MKGNPGYDEVMIVNPYDTRSNNQKQVNLMRYEQLPPEMGYYGEHPDMGYYGEPAGYGYYAEPQDGYYGEHPDMGEHEPVGYYADEYPSHPIGWYGDPEMVGYGTYEPLGESEQGVGYYGEQDIAG